MKKSTLSAAVFFLILGFLFTSQPARTQEFSITPPPLAYPKFSEPNTTQGKVTGTYLSVSGEGFDLTGIGVSYTGRSVLDRTKNDLGQGVGYAGGVFLISGTDIDGIALTALGNYERELFDKGKSNLIGFVGPNFTYAYLGSETTDIEIVMGGLQAGVQFSFESNDLLLSPFFMYVSAGGSVWVNEVEFGFDTESTLIGFDALIVSKGITLSGLLQDTSGDSNSDSLILQVSFTFGPQSNDAKGGTPPRPAQRGGFQSPGVPGDSIWVRKR